MLLLVLLFTYLRGGFKHVLVAGFVFAIGVVISLLILLHNSEQYLNTYGIVIKSSQNYVLLITLKGKYYLSSKNNEFNLLDIIKFEGKTIKLSFSHYESTFSFKNYLLNQGVSAELKVSNCNVIFRSFLNIRKYQEWVLQFFNPTEKVLAKSILFFKSPSEIEELNMLQKSGLITSLFSCGIHVNLFISFLHKLFSMKDKRDNSKIITLPVLLFFCFASNLSFSGIRLLIKEIIDTILSIKKKKYQSLDRYSLVYLIMLFIFLRFCMETTFWIPFLLMIFNILFSYSIKRINGIRRLLFKGLLPACIITPCLLFTNGIYGLFNFLLTPLLLNFGSVFFILFFPCYLIPWIGFLLNPICGLLIIVLNSMNGFSIFVLRGDYSFAVLISSIFILFLISILLLLKTKKALIIFECLFLILILTPTMTSYFPKYEVHFIDVGQGSSTLIRNGVSNILIDTGGSLYVDLAKDCLIPYFERIGVDKLDYVLLTHGDMDHDGALNSLISNFNVNGYEYCENTKEFFEIAGINFMNLNANPKYDDENGKSGVLKFNVRNTSFMIMGDATKAVENDILKMNIDLKSNVILLGHHGSKTSSSKDFIEKVDPQLAVISVGEKNKYGHPNKEVLETCTQLFLPIHRTDLSGTLVYKC